MIISEKYKFVYTRGHREGMANMNKIKSFYDNLPSEWDCYYDMEISENRIIIYQKPILFMQILAGTTALDDQYSLVDFLFAINNSPWYKQYDEARKAMRNFSLLSDIMNPHFVDSYIIVCEEENNK